VHSVCAQAQADTSPRENMTLIQGGRHDVANIECFAAGLPTRKVTAAPREAVGCIPDRCADVLVGLHHGAQCPSFIYVQ
jgi:hypothetical protein